MNDNFQYACGQLFYVHELIQQKFSEMSITGQLQRVVTLRIYTFICVFIVPFVLLSLYGWTHCQNDLLYGFDPRVERDRHVVVFGASKNREPTKTLEVIKKKKTILYWTKMFSSKNFYFGEGDIFKGCPVWSCMGTDNRNYQSVDKFDAVMFHGPELNEEDLPKKRSLNQRYIFMDLETQVFHPIPNKSVFNHFFNWTMAYRRDADIMRPYGVFKDITYNQIIPPHIPAQWTNVSNAVVPKSTHILYQKKTKIAAWFVSHCWTNSKREEVVRKLQNYVRVDVYGKCGKFECPRTTEIECYEKLEAEYFFYLSFENSMCRDYLTEKIFKALQYNVVPIVYGAADYESFLPPNSYINVLDFPSIETLAKFLVELSKDEERYLSYFKWKSFYQVITTKDHAICEFCKALHEPNLPNQVIQNIYKWWVNGSECRSPPGIS